MVTILEKIAEYKRDEVTVAKKRFPLSSIEEAAKKASPARGFAHALLKKAQSGKYGLIAEIKKASPSKVSVKTLIRLLSPKPMRLVGPLVFLF